MRLGWVVASGALTLGLVACGSGGDDDGGGGSGGQAATTPTTGLAVLGETFEDPEGSYEIEVDPDWEAHHGEIAEGVEVWAVGQSQDGFAPNINVLTQPAPGVDDLSDYLDASVQSGPAIMPEFELVDSDVVQGTESELGIIEYTGTQNDRQLHFLATVALQDGEAIVATFTAPADGFDQVRDEIEPYLLTLRSA